MDKSTIAVQVVVERGARAEVTSIGEDAVTVHVTGRLAQPSIHWASLEELEAWYAELGEKIHAERVRRDDIRLAIAEARAALPPTPVGAVR